MDVRVHFSGPTFRLRKTRPASNAAAAIRLPVRPVRAEESAPLSRTAKRASLAPASIIPLRNRRATSARPFAIARLKRESARPKVELDLPRRATACLARKWTCEARGHSDRGWICGLLSHASRRRAYRAQPRRLGRSRSCGMRMSIIVLRRGLRVGSPPPLRGRSAARRADGRGVIS